MDPQAIEEATQAIEILDSEDGATSSSILQPITPLSVPQSVPMIYIIVPKNFSEKMIKRIAISEARIIKLEEGVKPYIEDKMNSVV